jgi:cyclic pyranopterin phosphate synthase
VPVKDLTLLNHRDILSYEEILRVLQAAAEIGIEKVRLTGGEPLVRRNFVHLVESVCRMSAFKDVSITTNGVHLKEKAQEIFDAGIRRINVSLDTLDPVKYAKITGRDYFDNVWEGLEEAEAVGFSPIKLNVVAIRGINDDELLDFAQLSLRKPYHIRFIEYMPIGHDNRWRPEKYISSDEIKYKLESYSPLYRIPHLTDDGPARRCRFESAKGELGFISALSHHFCSTCNRLRLTADGRLRPCLFSEDEVDIKTPLRSGCSQEHLRSVFQQAIAKKPKGHHANISEKVHCLRTMSAIGG